MDPNTLMAAATGFDALGKLWAGSKSNKYQRNKRRNDMKLAMSYGIHPLAAWGTAGSAMGDGGYGTMSQGFTAAADGAASFAARKAAKQEKARLEAREDAKDQRMLELEIYRAATDPHTRREMEERMLGEAITPKPNPRTASEAVKKLDNGLYEFVDDLGNTLQVGWNALPEALKSLFK